MHVQFLEPVFFRTSFSLPYDHPIFSLQRTVQSPISSICRHLIKPVLQKIRLLQVAWIATSDWLKLRGSHKYSQQRPTCCKTGLPWASKSCNMYRFPAKWRTILYFLDQVFATCNDSMNTVEPPVSDHPKWKDWVVAYRRWSLTRIEPPGAPSKMRSGHIHFMEDAKCSSVLLLKFFVYCK